MVAEQSWANGVRAEALAKLYLTRHHELDVIPVSQFSRSPRYDILVRVHKDGMSESPEFAVEVKGTRATPSTRITSKRFPINLEAVSDSDLPVVLFVFDVDNETGFYGWLNEPAVEADGKAVLRVNRDWQVSADSRRMTPIPFNSLQSLDDEAVDAIVRRVVEWSGVRSLATLSADAWNRIQG